MIDHKPVPVSAVVALDRPQPRFTFETTLRINGPTPVRLVAERTGGRFFVCKDHVKTLGKGACPTPPGRR